jgi:5-methylcytosine-specific restriction endonuclease McrA
VKGVWPKCPPLRLDRGSYRQLRQEVLRRDGWKCQWCGRVENLQVHHQKFRSHSGGDNEENLITLCEACHKSVHRPSRMSGAKESQVFERLMARYLQ